MKKVLKNIFIGYVYMMASSTIMVLLSLHKLEKRIGRDIEQEDIEILALNDPLVQFLGNIDNDVLRTMITILCMPYIYISCSNTANKIEF